MQLLSSSLSLSLSSLVGMNPTLNDFLSLGWRKKLWGESACPPAGRPGLKQVAGQAAQQLQASTQPLSLPPQVPASSRYCHTFCVKFDEMLCEPMPLLFA